MSPSTEPNAPAPIGPIRLPRCGRRPLGFVGALVLRAETSGPFRHEIELYLTDQGDAIAAVRAATERQDGVFYADAAPIASLHDLHAFLDGYAPERIAPAPDLPANDPTAPGPWTAYAETLTAVQADFDALRAKLPIPPRNAAA